MTLWNPQFERALLDQSSVAIDLDALGVRPQHNLNIVKAEPPSNFDRFAENVNVPRDGDPADESDLADGDGYLGEIDRV